MKEIDTLTEKVGLPVCVDDGTGPYEGSDTVFVVAGNGFFKVVDVGGMRAVFPVEALPGVETMAKGLSWHGPKLPLSHLMFLKKMMFDFSEQHGGMELDVHIFHSDEDGWWYGIPWQEISCASTDWDTEKGYVWIHEFRQCDHAPVDRLAKIGNIHSHHAMAPEWSTKDDKLHKTSEFGIQFVVGCMGRGFGVGCRLVMNGNWQDVDMDEIVDIGDVQPFTVPKDIYKTDKEAKAEAARKQPDSFKGKKGKSRVSPSEPSEMQPVVAGWPSLYDMEEVDFSSRYRI